MVDFSIHFLICSLCISLPLGGILLIHRILQKQNRIAYQYQLWFFIPIVWLLPLFSFFPLNYRKFFFFDFFKTSKSSSLKATTINFPTATGTPGTDWMEDFTISVGKETPNYIYYFVFGLWVVGMIVMLFFFLRSRIRFYHIETSALLIQNKNVKALAIACQKELHIKGNIPIYSTAFLNSPVLAGVFRPRIYLPISLISDLNLKELRYMLLHELQHYRHKDPFLKYLNNFAKILYWFHPLVWYSIKEMQNDCEVACDSSVLQLLKKEQYQDYGNTLINFAQKVSSSPFSFASPLGGTMSQMKKRIRNIASYHPATCAERLKGIGIFMLAAIVIFVSGSVLPVKASVETAQLPTEETIVSRDFSSFFGDYEGSFVLYDLKEETFHIYNEAKAKTRTSPDSTYKIYSALMALESGIITPEENEQIWDGTNYPIEQWNNNQNLYSALQYSVNWYFNRLDQAAGMKTLEDFYKKIEYGNQDLSGGLDSYWLESSLKISPVEQVALLNKFYHNSIGCNPKNIQTVKHALRIDDSPSGTLYGKTGTGNVNGQNISGWFIGFVESGDNTYLFATNIKGDEKASGSFATEITLDILESEGIY